jgi:methyl-accepting chemotaxis protein
MSAYFKNAKLAASIFAVCVVPLAVVIYLCAMAILTNLEVSGRVGKASTFISAVPEVADLITALQTERGLSVGFVRSQGATFAAERKVQIATSDKALQAFTSAVADGRLHALGAMSETAAMSAEQELRAIAKTRSDAEALSIDPAELGARYTGAIEKLIELIDTAYYASSDGRMKSELETYLSLLRGIEKAGQERAQGAALLAERTIPVAGLVKLEDSISAQAVLFEQYRRLADDELRAAWGKAATDTAFTSFEELRGKLTYAAGTGLPPGVRAEDWFGAATARIDRLYDLADTALSHLLGVTQNLLDEANNAMLFASLQGAIATVLSLGVALAASLSVSGSVRKITNAMTAIADSKFDTEVPFTERTNELGAMAKAVEVFRENGKKVAEMTEAEAARIIREQEARAQMMAELQRAFGDVVDAAVSGDFSRRVETEFPDAELNALATSVNNLVTTVDSGLAETTRVLGALARTDLTHRVEGSYEGAFARLKDDTNQVADKLSEIVGQLRTTSRALKTATSEILSGANDLSERTTKQAATIEETSATMEQLAATVMQNAERARGASKAASEVTHTAEEGGAVMTQATEAMERITASSAKISNIIGMIDDIAFQTNLLALNASVEAARAGDAGKGFAVVAIEVRRLAQSAASASGEVKALIEQSGTEVNTGSKLVSDAAARLGAMLSAARSTNELMEGIAKDSREQAAAIEEVNTAVRQLDEMTQHNAALVEETNAAIEQTEAQATELDRIVDVFTIADSVRGAAPATPAKTTAPARAPAPAPGKASGIKALQDKVKQAAKSYLTRGNTAVAEDEWSEF